MIFLYALTKEYKIGTYYPFLVCAHSINLYILGKIISSVIITINRYGDDKMTGL